MEENAKEQHGNKEEEASYSTRILLKCLQPFEKAATLKESQRWDDQDDTECLQNVTLAKSKWHQAWQPKFPCCVSCQAEFTVSMKWRKRRRHQSAGCGVFSPSPTCGRETCGWRNVLRACVSPLGPRRHPAQWLISTVAIWLTLLFRVTVAAGGEGFRHRADRGWTSHIGDESVSGRVVDPLEIQPKSDVGSTAQSSASQLIGFFKQEAGSVSNFWLSPH